MRCSKSICSFVAVWTHRCLVCTAAAATDAAAMAASWALPNAASAGGITAAWVHGTAKLEAGDEGRNDGAATPTLRTWTQRTAPSRTATHRHADVHRLMHFTTPRPLALRSVAAEVGASSELHIPLLADEAAPPPPPPHGVDNLLMLPAAMNEAGPPAASLDMAVDELSPAGRKRKDSHDALTTSAAHVQPSDYDACMAIVLS